MGLSATGDSLLSSEICLPESSSGVGSLGSAVSKDVWLDTESRNVGRVEVLEIVRESVVLLGERRVLRALPTGKVSES